MQQNPDPDTVLDEARVNRNREFEQKNAVITRMDIPSEVFGKLQDLMNNPHIIDESKEMRVRKAIGGSCCMCRGLPLFFATYTYIMDNQVCKRIERYCETCLKKTFPNYKINRSE